MRYTLLSTLVAAGISLGATSLSADETTVEFAAASVRRAAGGTLVVPFRDAYQLNLDVPGTARARQLRLGYNDLFSIEGNSIRCSLREGGAWRTRSVYDGGSAILAIQEAAVRDQLLVLDAISLKLVDFSDDAPKILSSYTIDNTRLAAGGHYIERFADNVYVVDASLPGFRVLSIEDPANFEQVTSFTAAASPSEIRIRSGYVYLLTAEDLKAISVKEFIAPQPEQRAVLRGSGTMHTLAFDSAGRGYLAEGSSLKVIEMNPESSSFLKVESSLQMPAAIDQLMIQDGRAFILDATGALEVVDVSRPSAGDTAQEK